MNLMTTGTNAMNLREFKTDSGEFDAWRPLHAIDNGHGEMREILDLIEEQIEDDSVNALLRALHLMLDKQVTAHSALFQYFKLQNFGLATKSPDEIGARLAKNGFSHLAAEEIESVYRHLNNTRRAINERGDLNAANCFLDHITHAMHNIRNEERKEPAQ